MYKNHFFKLFLVILISLLVTTAATAGTGIFIDSGQSLGSWNTWRVALGDLDGDDDLDAFAANSLASNKVWINDGSGNFADNDHNVGGNTPSFNVALGDLDSDGDLDAFVVDSSDVNRVWGNDGTGIFSLKQNVSSSSSRSDCVALGDLDGDGDLDAFIVNHDQPNEIWLNNGTGFFSDSGQRLGGNGHSSAVALGDLDGDSDLDAFVGNIDRFANKVWLNNGTGVFNDSGQSLGNSSSRDVALGDLDNDGDLDAFIANWENLANKVWLNNGNGSFSDSGQDPVGISSAGAALGDVDGDGDLDVFVTHYAYANQPNAVWLNDGKGIFSDSGQSLGASASMGVALGDLDSDGDLDAFIANQNNQGNRVWQNGGGNTEPEVTVSHTLVTVNEGQTAFNTGTASDPDGDVVMLSASVGTVANNNNDTWSWSFTTNDGPAETQTVTIFADDGNGGTRQATFELVVNNIAPTVGTITAPRDPIGVNTSVSVSTDFIDPAGINDEPFTCTVNYGDGSGDLIGTVSGNTCTGLVHLYTSPGVHTVMSTVTDKDGDSGASIFQFVVVFDPDGGFVTGGGWIDSPVGAYTPDPSLTGTANFGFVSKYKKGANVPTGQTEFQFQVASLNFHSTSYDWLVVAGHKAKFKGTGTINGAGNYGFMVSAVDEKLTPSTDIDLFRIKIWDKDNGDVIVYDNQLGADDDADPTTVIQGGNIVIHKAK